MIPISDTIRRRSFPYVNVAIILVNLLVFLYEVYLSNEPSGFRATRLDEFVADWGNIPACTLDSLGADVDLSPRQEAVCADQPNPLLTLITAMFMHGSWAHIAFNMLFLWIFGDNVEDRFGHLRYLAFYLITGVAAAFGHALFNMSETVPAVGASGAISGVMGAYIVMFPRATVFVILGFILIPLPLPAFVLIGIWFILQVFSGVASLGPDAVGAEGGVAYFAHIGGFVAGALLVPLFLAGRPQPRAVYAD